MIKSKYILQCRKPHGFAGRVLLSLMDIWHRPFAYWVMSSIDLPASAAAIDIGCGSGLYMRMLLKRGCLRADGIDISGESIRRTRRSMRRYGSRSIAEIASSECIPFQDGSYDAAIAADTVIYWDDPVRSFSEVCRILKPGGVFYIASELSDAGDAPRWIQRSGALYIRTPSELADALRAAGFEDISIHCVHGPWMTMKAAKASN